MSNHTKTIFITSFQGLVSRVLASGILDYLKKDENINIVIFVPEFKKEYFKKEFADERITIEPIDEKKNVSKSSRVFQRIALVLLSTKSMRIMKRSPRWYKNYFQFLSTELPARLFGRWSFFRTLFRTLNYHFSGKSVFGLYFEKYKPDLVLSMDVKHILDAQILLEAKKRNVFTMGMVRSWDYLTAKGILRVLPDKLIVHNELIKNEAIRYADINNENIFVTGIPHFDPYVNTKRSSREEFFSRIGGNPEKPLILLAPTGDRFGNTDWQIFEILRQAIEKNELPSNLQVLVRIPPGDTVSLGDFKKSGNILFDYPGARFREHSRKGNEMSFSDLLHLADSIFYSKLVITGPSTMYIDAVALNSPAIFLGFDGWQKRSYYNSVRHYYDFNHLQNIVSTAGVLMAKTEKELLKFVNEYLVNPELHASSRKEIVAQQCGKLDGQSSRRMVDFILSFLD